MTRAKVSLLLVLIFFVLPLTNKPSLASPENSTLENQIVLGTSSDNLWESLVSSGQNQFTHINRKVSGFFQSFSQPDDSFPGALLNLGRNPSPMPRSVESLVFLANNSLLGPSKNAQAACPAPPAYCTGRDRLDLVFSVWDVFRRLSYVILVLVLVIYGFMVMLRYKVDPRTVITLQSALPRVAIALVLVTFSYTIAAAVIDITQLGLASVKFAFTNGNNYFNTPSCSGPDCPPPNLLPFMGDPMVYQTKVMSKVPIKAPAIQLFPNIPFLDRLDLAGLVEAGMKFAIWFLFFQLLFVLIQRYLAIVLTTFMAPILLVVGVIPGRSDAISRWLGNLLANGLSFAGIYFLLNLAIYFGYKIADTGSNFGLPSPIVSGASFTISGMVTLGIIMICTQVPSLLEEAFNVVPSGHTQRSSFDLMGAMRKAPIIGGLFG